MRPSLLQRLALPALALLLSSCITLGSADKPIGTVLVPAPEPGAERTLVIVLPGFGSDAGDLDERGIGAAIHRRWPQADVLLTSTTMAYYARGNAIPRLQTDVIEPARRQGYRQIWLAGASVGGMGVLFYERQYPGELTGLVLMAPWLGSKDMLEEIRSAGGIRSWDPGPVPAVIDRDNFEREMWRVIKHWSDNPASAERVWLICGDQDRMLPGSRLLAPAIPDTHYIELPGGHDWQTFATATDRIIGRIRGQDASLPAAPAS